MHLSLRHSRYVVGAVALLSSLGSFASAQTSPISSIVPPVVSNGQAAVSGPVEDSLILQLTLNLPTRNQAGLDSLLQQLYDPQSSSYHHYLSVEEYTRQFGPTQADYDALVQWAQSKGFTVTGTTPNRRLVNVSASTPVIRSAFKINLNYYLDSQTGRKFYAPDREPSLDFATKLLAVTGLTNVNPPVPHYKQGSRLMESKNVNEAMRVIAHITGSGPGNTYLPSDMRAAYYGSGPLTGAGQTVGIFSYDGYLTNDIQIYFSNTGMTSSIPVHNVLVAGYNGACFGFNNNGTENPNTCDDGEQILDIVNVMGMAPGLTQILFYEGSSSTSVLNQMATDNTAKVLSSSWGGGDFGSASDPAFQEFQAQGQTYLNATGDSGAFNSSTYAPPSVDPNITQVGGTDLTTSGAGGPWASETGWAESGGGYVSGTAIPSYQQLSGVINSSNKGSTTLRNAPDVAAEANYDNTTVIDGSFESGYGGTSFATPRWAGYIALANQQSIANGNSTIGFLNPKIYNIGVSSAYATNFHDITSGNNKPTAGSGSGFNAVTGYDLVTGWGSPNGATLINNLAGTSGGGTANFTLSASPSSLSIVAGSSGTSTITITPSNGFASAVSLTASGMPTGVTASFNPASATTTSTLTLTVSSSAAVGSSTITITGVSSGLTHTTTVGLTVTTAGGGSTQLLGNTGFENGTNTAPWTLSSGVICSTSTCGGESPHSGSWFAWLDGYGQTHTDTASQQVTIPSGKTTASLVFYLHIDTAETTKSVAYDTLTIQVLNTSGTVLGTLGTFSNLNAATGYVQHTYSMSSYIGQTVVLKFTGNEDSSLQTSFVLDDITLTVQ